MEISGNKNEECYYKPQSPVNTCVHYNQGEQRNDAMDDEIEIDDINLIVVAVLTKTGPNNYQILRKA